MTDKIEDWYSSSYKSIKTASWRSCRDKYMDTVRERGFKLCLGFSLPESLGLKLLTVRTLSPVTRAGANRTRDLRYPFFNDLSIC